jgi:hypothetical protein
VKEATMTDTELPTNVTPLRPKDPTAALRARRARRKRKSVTRTVTPPVTASSIAPPENLNEIKPSVTVVGNAVRHVTRHDGMSGIDIGRSIAVRDAARNAASVAAPESGNVARLLTLDGPATPRIEVLPPRYRPWSAIGRAGVGLAIVATGAWIAYTSMRGNSWFGHSLTPDPAAGEIYSNLSVAAEVLACLIPTGIRFYWTSGEPGSAMRGWTLMAVALVVVFFAAGGFAVTNISLGIEARAERETPAMRDLRTQIAGLDKSIASECSKRGDRCRDFERQRAEANAKLGIERASLKADADPQAAALGVSSTSLHLVQAGAMVALCLFSGLFISFGAGLVWPR